ncbi:MAG: mucoidy inhibitor MuiA family protein [Candidatus Hodarchaeales archaeon]
MLKTQITQVTVYPSKALILREGTVNIPPAKSISAEITNLPVHLDPSSIRVKGTSVTGTIIEGIDIKRISHLQASKPDQNLLDKLQDLSYQEEHLLKTISFLETRSKNNNLLESQFGKDFARYFSKGTITLDQFQALQKQLETDHKEILIRTKELDIKLATIKQQKRIVEKKIADRDVSSKPDDYSVIVFLNNPATEKEDKFRLELNYVINGAYWTPLYDFRANIGKGEVLIDYYGNVVQTTGEDWNNVQLILSTASPDVITTIPKLDPWYLDLYLPLPPPKPMAAPSGGIRRKMKSGKRDEREVLDLHTPTRVAEEAPEPMEAKQLAATIEDMGETQIFNIPKKESIPSEKAPHQVLIAQITNPLKDDFLSIPVISSDIIHRGEMANESDFILLKGEVRLFADNEFIRKTRIKQIAPTEKYEFVLGTTGKIKVIRKLSSQELAKKGMISKTRHRQMEVTIEVTNNRKEVTILYVKDRLPKSRHEDIKVKIVNLVPPPCKHTKLNQCTWEFKLKSQEKQTIVETYDIEHAADQTITGI